MSVYYTYTVGNCRLVPSIGVLTMSTTDTNTSDSTDYPQTTDIDDGNITEYGNSINVYQSGAAVTVTDKQTVTVTRHEDMGKTQIYVSDANSTMSVCMWVTHTAGSKVEQICKETGISVSFEVKD